MVLSQQIAEDEDWMRRNKSEAEVEEERGWVDVEVILIMRTTAIAPRGADGGCLSKVAPDTRAAEGRRRWWGRPVM